MLTRLSTGLQRAVRELARAHPADDQRLGRLGQRGGRDRRPPGEAHQRRRQGQPGDVERRRQDPRRAGSRDRDRGRRQRAEPGLGLLRAVQGRAGDRAVVRRDLRRQRGLLPQRNHPAVGAVRFHGRGEEGRRLQVRPVLLRGGGHLRQFGHNAEGTGTQGGRDGGLHAGDLRQRHQLRRPVPGRETARGRRDRGWRGQHDHPERLRVLRPAGLPPASDRQRWHGDGGLGHEPGRQRGDHGPAELPRVRHLDPGRAGLPGRPEKVRAVRPHLAQLRRERGRDLGGRHALRGGGHGRPARQRPHPADVIKGLYALHGETLGGLAPPLAKSRWN